MEFKTLEQDRNYLENKYHKTSEPFDGYKRRNYHGYEYDASTGLDDEQIREGLDKLEKELYGLSHPIIKAKMVEYVLKNTRIDVNEHDYFVGFYTWGRVIEKTVIKWRDEIIANTGELCNQMQDFNTCGASAIWPDFDHVVPHFDSLMSLGFAGIKKRAQDYCKKREESGTLTKEQKDFFDAIDITYTAILDIIDRLYCYAISQTHAKSHKIAQSLLHLKEGAPTNIYDAMQLIYIYFIISDGIECYQVRSLGHGLDSTLYPFYIKDLSDGTFTRDEIKEFLAYFLMQWSAIGNVMGQPFYIGGTDENGNTKYNDLSRDILDVYEYLGIFDPKIQVKVNTNTPPEILNKIFNMIRNGQTSFAFCCEPGMTKAAMSYGATFDEARNMDIRGCYETGVRANEVVTATAYINSLKSVEYAFNNGFDIAINKQIGIKTGDVSEFKTFEEFYNAVLKQWDYLIESSMKIVNAFEPHLKDMNPSNMYSATIPGSLENARDAYQDGVKFNNTCMLNCGFASLVDSVMAVKWLVFDKKETTLTELAAALRNNWTGYELLRAKALSCPRKYGNNDFETDTYAEALATYFASKVNHRPNARGGIYKSTTHPAMMFKWHGEKTGASPDGRKKGDEMSKNSSPSIGMDKNGITALIHSAIKLKPYQYLESFCVDIMLHPSAVKGDEGLVAMRALLDTYMKNGGMSMQFNIFNSDNLRDAQKHPEKYKTLQVRVCGWNNLWNDLSPDEQESYIERTKNML